VLILFLPVVNLIMFPVIWVETLRTFGKKSQKDTILGIVTLGFYIYSVNYSQNIVYDNNRSFKEHTLSSILYAIVFAATVHAYFMQPFIIPTSSLEKSLLVGDFLLVSKFHYGARPPMTTVAAPMVHDTIPLAKIKSYTNFPQAPYLRVPGFQEIKPTDIVVFNWPVDTVRFFRDKTSVGIRKPIDKKSNYVKRCVGVAGDSLQIKDGVVYTNGKVLPLPERAKLQHFYTIYFKDFADKSILNDYEITEYHENYKIKKVLWNNNLVQDYLNSNEDDGAAFLNKIAEDSTYVTVSGGITEKKFNKLRMEFDRKIISVNLTDEKAERLKTDSRIEKAIKNINEPNQTVFPHTKNWSIDNFGPIYIPKAGATVALTSETLPFYKEIIKEYEHNTLEVKNNQIYINGTVATTYTFQQNYYWMMGDNRHNSEDSRIWGYVPEDHIVGKPVFIWMSWDTNGKGIINKIRWERMFTTVGGDGKPYSYFKFFLLFLALYLGWDYYRTRKAKNKIEE